MMAHAIKRTGVDRDRFDPERIRELGRIDWIANALVQGLTTGMHRNKNKGFSTEFKELRPYTAGDDTRFLDWRVYARTERCYIRSYEAETSLECLFVVDGSQSMAWRWHNRVTKQEYAANLVAALSLLLVLQQDRVGLFVGSSEPPLFVPFGSRRSKLDEIWRALAPAASVVAGSAGLGRLLTELTALPRHRGQVIVLSDLEEEYDTVAGRLPVLAARGDEVILIHLLDAAEVVLPYAPEVSYLQDSETGALLDVSMDELRAHHAARVTQFRDRWRDAFQRENILYIGLDTSVNYLDALLGVIMKKNL